MNSNAGHRVVTLPTKYTDKKYYLMLSFLSNAEYSVDLQETNKVTVGNMANGKYKVVENVIYLDNEQAYYRPTENIIYYPSYGVSVVKQVP